MTPAFAVLDLRRPGQPMAALPLKIPTESLTALQAQADRLRCNRRALARTLNVRDLERLQAEPRPGGNSRTAGGAAP